MAQLAKAPTIKASCQHVKQCLPIIIIIIIIGSLLFDFLGKTKITTAGDPLIVGVCQPPNQLLANTANLI